MVRLYVETINELYQRTEKKDTMYFEECPQQLLELVHDKLQKTNKTKSAHNVFGNQRVDGRGRGRSVKEKNELQLIASTKQGIEQTLIAMNRWDVLPNRDVSVYEFMKNRLKLFEDECQIFNEMKGTLQLKHCQSLWKYLDKVYVLKQGRWHQVDKMHIELCYKTLIKESNTKTRLKKFVNNFDKDVVWDFLMEWLDFIERRLCDPEKVINQPERYKLKEWLQQDIMMDDRSEEEKLKLFKAFPDEILLSQTKDAYHIVAKHLKQSYSE